MSHVDDGILHAYLDGELAPVERERVEAHLAACLACQARFSEEQALIERAGRLLDLAAPAAPTPVAPPLHTLRRRPTWWRIRLPIAWAATVVFAIGLGWYLRGRPGTITVAVQPADEHPAAAPASKSVSQAAPAERAFASPSPAPTPSAAQGPPARAEVAADHLAIPSSPQAAAAKVAPSRQNEPEAVTVQTGRIDSAPVADVGVASGRSSRVDLPSTWTLVDSAAAHSILGRAPATIPERAVRALRRGPGPVPEVAVEQDMGGGVVIVLIEQAAQRQTEEARHEQVARDARSGVTLRGQMAQAAGERLARFVGSLRVEIAGPLSADSLTQLLELVR